MSRTRITVSNVTGSERGASASEGESSDTGVHVSPASRDYSDSADEEYEFIGGEDDIEPSDSASRPRTSRRNSRQDLPPVEGPPPNRRHSQAAPRRHPSIPHRPAPPPRDPSRPRNPPSDPDSVLYPDEYVDRPPPRAPYPSQHPASEWQRIPHFPAATPSVMSYGYHHGPPYMGPPESRLALSAPHQDPYGYGGNPFTPSYHPFSPAASSPSSGPGGGYFDPAYPPPPPPPPPRERGYSRPPPSHRHSMHSMYGEMDVMRFPPVPPGYMPPWAYAPPQPPPSPPKPAPAAAPAPAPAPPPPPPPPPPDKKDDSEYKELLKLIQKHEEDRIKREEEIRAKEAAQAEAKKKAEEAAAALEAAASNARKDAETKAAEEAKKAKEEADKALEDAKKAADKALEEAKKAAEDNKNEAEQHKKDLEAAKKPKDDKQAPIQFKDAVGRKFSFPFHLCKTWKGMEDLICQAFNHVDLIGQHVQDGHYDLMGPNGEIILPQVWETVVEPAWSISMHMWPMEEPEKPKDLGLPPGAFDPGAMLMDIGPPPGRGGKPKKGKGKMVPPAPPPPPGGPGPGGPSALDAMLAGAPMPPAHGGPPGVVMVPESGAVKSLGSKKKKDVTPMMAWMAGGGRKSGSGKGAKELELLTATGGVGFGGQRMREPARKVVATSEGFSCVVM